jgi:hypothetical protein
MEAKIQRASTPSNTKKERSLTAFTTKVDKATKLRVPLKKPGRLPNSNIPSLRCIVEAIRRYRADGVAGATVGETMTNMGKALGGRQKMQMAALCAWHAAEHGSRLTVSTFVKRTRALLNGATYSGMHEDVKGTLERAKELLKVALGDAADEAEAEAEAPVAVPVAPAAVAEPVAQAAEAAAARAATPWTPEVLAICEEVAAAAREAEAVDFVDSCLA